MRSKLRHILATLAADPEADILQDPKSGVTYLACTRIQPRNLIDLLRLTAVSETSPGYYGINATGRALLRRPELEHELTTVLLSGKPFTVHNDHIVLLDTDPRYKTP